MKKHLLIILSVMLMISMNTISYASTTEGAESGGNPELLPTDEKYIEKLVSGEIEAVNEDCDFDISNIVVSESMCEMENIEYSLVIDGMNNLNIGENDDFDLVDSEVIVDNRKINSENTGMVESYCTNIIIKSTFELSNASLNNEGVAAPMLNQTDEDTMADVTVGAKITYDKITIQSGVYAYKITKMYGKYISTSDPQMKCSLLQGKTRGHGASLKYKSATSSVAAGKDANTGKVTIKSSPTKGTWYSYPTEQSYYYRSDDGSYNRTNIYYTVKRTTSSYTNEYYIPLGFGNISPGSI